MMIDKIKKDLDIKDEDFMNKAYRFLRDNKQYFNDDDKKLINECPKSLICVSNLISKLMERHEELIYNEFSNRNN